MHTYVNDLFDREEDLPVQQINEKVFNEQTNLEDFWTELYIQN